MTGPEFSIVIPCLNEAGTIGVVIAKARAALAALRVPGEIVVADNGSDDGSRGIAADAGARVVEVEEKGYGSALAGGIAAARGTYVIMGDADDTYDLTAIEPFIERLRDGYDLVMGNRFKGGIENGAMPWLHRYVGNPVLSGLGKVFFHSPIGDFHCGLRGFRKDAVERMDLRTTGMEFASEMIVKASLFRLKVTEVPTTLSPGLQARAPHLRTWRDGWRHLRFLLLYSPRWLFLYPGLLLMLVGLAGLLWLLPGPRIVGNIGFDVHSLLFAAVAIVVGFQSVVFAVLTKVYATNEGLLPPSARLDRIFRYVTLEVGLAAGAILLIAGLGGSVAAFLRWSDVSFRALDPSVILRIIIPSVTAVVLGFETILASFFLSILGLPHR